MRALPSYDEVTGLPGAPRTRVAAELGDSNGHMNVRHYLGTFDDAAWTAYAALGLAADGSAGGNVFALEQYLTYRREVLVGAEVSVHLRVVGRTSRMLHVVGYLLDHESAHVSASLESLEAFVGHTTRRMAPFPAAVADALDRWAAEHAALPWSPELSGAMSLGGRS